MRRIYGIPVSSFIHTYNTQQLPYNTTIIWYAPRAFPLPPDSSATLRLHALLYFVRSEARKKVYLYACVPDDEMMLQEFCCMCSFLCACVFLFLFRCLGLRCVWVEALCALCDVGQIVDEMAPSCPLLSECRWRNERVLFTRDCLVWMSRGPVWRLVAFSAGVCLCLSGYTKSG